MADVAILRYDAPAFHLMKEAMLCVKSMIEDLICVNYIHSAGEITFHT